MTRHLLILPLLVLIPACASFKKVNIYTEPEEMAIGEIFSSQVEGVYPVLRDPRVSWYVNHRGRQFAELSDRPELPYDFGVVDSPELNAFAIPGGHIYFNLGMIEAAEHESWLMGIVAHEIGHVVAKHSMKQISQSSIVGIVGNVALGQYPNQWAALAANLFGATGFLKMSRDAEREADTIGFELMLRAGYDPTGMVHIFESLIARYQREPQLLDKLFSTHPPTQERIDNLNAMMAAREMPPNLIQTTPEYETMYAHILEEYYSEGGRRRWKDILETRDDPEKRKKDRLPWDTKSDEEDEKRDAKRKKKEEEERKKREEAEAEKDREDGAAQVVGSLVAPGRTAPGRTAPGRTEIGVNR